MSPEWNWKELSPLALAFMGDAVWEVYVRNHVLEQGIRRPEVLHRVSTSYVRASAQAAIVARLYDTLTDEEQQQVRKGRNAKPAHTRKNADVLDYRHSTGFEALLGYLYGSGQQARMEEICRQATAIIDNQEARSSE